METTFRKDWNCRKWKIPLNFLDENRHRWKLSLESWIQIVRGGNYLYNFFGENYPRWKYRSLDGIFLSGN